MNTSLRLRMLLTLTVFAIAPALLIELAAAAARTALVVQSPGLVGETLGGVTWSLLVCFGVAVGSALSRVSDLVAGAIAFACTPLALVAAKSLQAGVNEVLDQAPTSLPPGLVLIAAIKACEYGALAYVLSRLAKRGTDAFAPHLAAALIAALTFGSGVVYVTATAPDPDLPIAALSATAINELLFPIGCALAVLLTRIVHPAAPTRSPAPER